MRILLTGGAGYIGLHTAVYLSGQGHELFVADNYSNSDAEMVHRAEQLIGAPLKVYELDVSDPAALSAAFEDCRPEAVIHFAALKAVGESVQEPLRYYRNNLGATLSVLDCMEKHGVKTLIFSSSATVYRSDDPVPFTETMPLGSINPYGWTKVMSEEIIRSYFAAHPDFSGVLLRYFNPLGCHESGLIGEKPRGIPNNLMPYVTLVACGKQPILNVYGNDYPTPDGTCIRDYIHVMDLAEGHAAALTYAVNTTGCEAVNLGSGTGYSVLEIIAAFEKANGVPVPYRITGRRAGDLPECYADISKARLLLSWEPHRTLEAMCRDSWRWQQTMERDNAL